MTVLTEEEKSIEQWRIKKLIKTLDDAKGEGTSMISLILPPKSQINQAATMLTEEYGTASNIKSRVNRLSVLDAITSTQQRLKLYKQCPPNGLCIFCGKIQTDKGSKKITIDFEPFKPISASLYLCDNKFHTEALQSLLESDERFGFIIMDGNGALFGVLQGNTRIILNKFLVDLPKKHGRGGQSALRFARLRTEKRHNYVRKVAEVAVQCFITQDKINVSGLILAGSADFKSELGTSDLLDIRLQQKILKIVDISYGGENGFNQAIDLVAEDLRNVQFIQEKKLIQLYFDEIGQDSGKYVFGLKDTMAALEMGAVQKLILWEGLEVSRVELKNPMTGEESIKFLTPKQETDASNYVDKATNVELTVVEKEPLTDWFIVNYKRFGCSLHFVTNKSQEGSQFCRGFGGIGGILGYKVDLTYIHQADQEAEKEKNPATDYDDADDNNNGDNGLDWDDITNFF